MGTSVGDQLTCGVEDGGSGATGAFFAILISTNNFSEKLLVLAFIASFCHSSFLLSNLIVSNRPSPNKKPASYIGTVELVPSTQAPFI